jgi:hypothetical protein
VVQDPKNDFFQVHTQAIMKTIVGAETIILLQENSHNTATAAV